MSSLEPSSGPATDVDEFECFNCHEMDTECESVVIYTHRIDGFAVAQDHEDVCKDCLEEVEMGDWP